MSPGEQKQLIERELSDFKLQVQLSSSCRSRVQRLVNYIETHLFEPWLNAEAVTRACNVHPGRVNLLLRRRTGLTVRETIERGRIRAAQTLLCHEELGASDVAFAVGYRTYSTFRRAFKRTTGTAPSQWSQENGSDENAG